MEEAIENKDMIQKETSIDEKIQLPNVNITTSEPTSFNVEEKL